MGRGCRARAHRKSVREGVVHYTADWQQVNGLKPPQRCSLESAPPQRRLEIKIFMLIVASRWKLIAEESNPL